MQAIGYIRVSTLEQSREGVSMEMQAAKIRAYAELNDFELIEIVSDDGISAKAIKGRDGIQKVLESVRTKKTAAVIIYKLDRLARNTIESLEMAKMMDKSGVALHSITEKLDTQSAMGKFFFTLTASLAEMERNIISERTSAALQEKRRQGKLAGKIPFGFTLAADGEALLENSQEKESLEIMRELRGRGLSLRAIASELESRGIKAKNGGRWHAKVIQGILGANSYGC